MQRDGDDLKWVHTRYRNAETDLSHWTSELRDLWDARKTYEPGKLETLPKWLNPQRAMVVLLLRAEADQNPSFALVGPEQPLARSLFDAIRHKSGATGEATWIQRVFGANRLLGLIFQTTGSSAGRLRVSLGPDLKKCKVIFSLHAKGVSKIVKDRGKLLKMAREIENQAIPPRQALKRRSSSRESDCDQAGNVSHTVSINAFPLPPELTASNTVFERCGLVSVFKIPEHDTFRQDRVKKIISAEANDSEPRFSLLASSGRSYLHPLGPVWDKFGLREAILKTGARMDVVLQSPFSDFGYARALACKVHHHHWEELLCVEDLSELSHRAKVRVRVSRLPINCSLFITRRSIIFDPYLWACPADGKRIENHFWVFEFKPTGKTAEDSYSLLTKHFRFLFDQGIALKNFLTMNGGYEKLTREFKSNMQNSKRQRRV